MTDLKKYVLIVAGGYGSRMGAEIPKQFISVAGKPLLIHTFEAFLKYSQDLIFILVLPSNQIDTWKKLSLEHSFSTPHLIREGGATRFQSVQRGLEVINEDGLVAIHDGVRPCVAPEVISASFRVAELKGSAIASVRVRESIRKQNNGIFEAVNRNDFMVIQTPQTFWISQIRNAYKVKEKETFTDDATVFESAGFQVTFIEGNYANIKITTPEDLYIAEGLLARK